MKKSKSSKPKELLDTLNKPNFVKQFEFQQVKTQVEVLTSTVDSLTSDESNITLELETLTNKVNSLTSRLASANFINTITTIGLYLLVGVSLVIALVK